MFLSAGPAIVMNHFAFFDLFLQDYIFIQIKTSFIFLNKTMSVIIV